MDSILIKALVPLIFVGGLVAVVLSFVALVFTIPDYFTKKYSLGKVGDSALSVIGLLIWVYAVGIVVLVLQLY